MDTKDTIPYPQVITKRHSHCWFCCHAKVATTLKDRQ